MWYGDMIDGMIGNCILGRNVDIVCYYGKKMLILFVSREIEGEIELLRGYLVL